MTALLLTLTVMAAYFAAFSMLRARSEIRIDFETIGPVLVVFAVTAVISGSQFVEPKILSSLQRDRDALISGQLWRIVTPLFVQDGGGSGTIFNLATLLLLGIPTALLLGSRRWLLLYFGTGLLSEIVAYTLIRQGSAGNSIANFGVAALLSLAAVWTRRLPASLLGAMAVVCGLILLVLGNLHGAAFLIGALLSLVVIKQLPHQLAVEPGHGGHSSAGP